MTNTAGLLTKVIEQQGISRNKLIHDSSIDRSSFYQILSGRRPGTIEQYARILSQFKLTPGLTQQLLEEYGARKYGNDCQQYELVDSWMKRLSSAEGNTGRTVHGVKNQNTVIRDLKRIILSQSDKNDADICLYIPLRFFTKIWMETDIPKLLDSMQNPHSIRILVAIDFNEQEKTEQQLELLFSFLFGLYHIRDFSRIVQCIHRDATEEGTPFPYFAITDTAVFLMNFSCDKGESVKQKGIVKEYRSFFAKLTAQPYEYLEEYASLQEFLGSLYHRFDDNSGPGKMNRMAERGLCMFKVCDAEMIRRYAQPELHELLASYLSEFQKMQSVFLNSSSAMQGFIQDHSVMENGIRISIDPLDAAKLCHKAESADDILLLQDAQDHLPGNWTFVLFSTGELMILPNWNCSQIISIHDPQLCHAFSAWFDVNHDMAMIRKELSEAAGI